MRIAVEGAGYRSACQAFVEGNQAAARVVLDLSDELSGHAGMAGDDSTATDFAAAYDEAAAAAIDVLAELVGGFASLARLADGSLRNHAEAERASVLPGWLESIADPPRGADLCTVVHVGPPASSLGADSSSLPGWANAVLDLLEGVFWPDADTERVRAAATTWRSAATSVGLLAGPCESALAELSLEVSPEIPLAVATTEDLRGRIESLSDQLTALGAACDDYAAQVDAKRAEMLDLLEQLAWELGIGAVAAGALTLFSGGAAAGAAGGAGAARIASASASLRGILQSLGALTRGTATTLRPVGATMRDTRAYFARLSAARTERGSANLSSFFSRSPRGLLDRHEGRALGHTIDRHVGKSPDWLHRRVLDRSSMGLASSFSGKATAERAVFDALRRHRFEIEEWLQVGSRLEIDARLDRVIGISVNRAGDVLDARSIRVVLVKDPSMPEGFHIKTAYPTP